MCVSSEEFVIVGSPSPLLYIFYNICACTKAHTFWSKDNFLELLLSFYHVGSGDQTQVVQFDNKYLYLTSHLAALGFLVLISCSSTFGMAF